MGCTAGKEFEVHGEDGTVNRSLPPKPTKEGHRPASGRSLSSGLGGKFSNFAKRALLLHNAYRETHQAEPLALHATLCEMAEELCRHLVRARTFANSNPENRMFEEEECGESLYRHWGSKDDRLTAETVCQSWYDEVDNYHHDMAGFDLATCHFTQMVWKKTRELGIAQAHYDDDDGFRKFVVVANYFPSGNIDGAYEMNVTIPEGFFDNNDLDKSNIL